MNVNNTDSSNANADSTNNNTVSVWIDQGSNKDYIYAAAGLSVSGEIF